MKIDSENRFSGKTYFYTIASCRTCSELQGNKFVEPLQQRLSEQNKARDALKKRWRKELRRVSEAVSEHSATRILGPNLQSFPSHHS